MKKQVFTLLLFSFCSLIFAQGKVTFEANITNRNADVIYIKNRDGKIIKEIKVDKKGVFKDSFKIIVVR